MPLKLRPAFAVILFSVIIAGCSPTAQFAEMRTSFIDMTNAEPEGEAQALATEDRTNVALAYAAPAAPVSTDRAHINRLIDKYAARYNVPASLVHRVVRRESTYNPKARNGIHIGLMQLNPRTARTMGFSGPNAALYDAETNLKYGVKYLAGAYMVAKGDAARADKLYQTGYYYHAKRMGLLEETGLRG